MLNKTSKLVLVLAFSFIVDAGLSFAQDSTDAKDSKHHGNMKGHMMNHETMMDSSKRMKNHKHMDHDKMMGSDHKEMMKDNKSIVHEGTIDLAAIDKNGDGKVYQDMMDWNVISDESGKCPICEMKLKEVTLNEAKVNLNKHGFEVK
jgi:hypothetical protein